jgi:hypothetical protein
MNIVAAGMFDSGIFGFVRNFIGFLDGQGIHVGPNSDDWSWFPAFYQSDHTMAGHSGPHVCNSQASEFFRHDSAGAFFAIGEFGILVKIASLLDEFRADCICH